MRGFAGLGYTGLPCVAFNSTMSKLTIDQLKESLNYNLDTGEFTRAKTVGRCDRWKAGSPVGHLAKNGYIQIWVGRKSYLAHRLAWFYVHCRWPEKHLDHINGCTTDNRISNLRECDDALNMQNIRRPHVDNKTGFLGVKLLPYGRYQSRIFDGKKEVNLGIYDTAEEAYDAYISAKRKLHEFCTI